MSHRGEREIDGRFFLLFNAMDWYEWDDAAEESLQREAAAARRRYDLVRVIKTRRGRAFIYVFGEK